MEISLERLEVKRLQFFEVVEIRTIWICLGVMLMQDVEVESVGPPLRRSLSLKGVRAMGYRTLG
jgi:hypothetical protein